VSEGTSEQDIINAANLIASNYNSGS